MSERVLMIGPAHTLREAARMMAARNVGAAVVVNPEHSGVGILTERDILNSVAAGESPDTETAGQHCTQDLVFASREWTLEDAAAAMVHGGFRHLVVVEGHEVVGLLSMREHRPRLVIGPRPGPGRRGQGNRRERRGRRGHHAVIQPSRRKNSSYAATFKEVLIELA